MSWLFPVTFIPWTPAPLTEAVIQEKGDRALAIHEAAHCFFFALLGFSVRQATIVPEGNAAGRVTHHTPAAEDADGPAARRWLCRNLLGTYAGPMAGWQAIGGDCPPLREVDDSAASDTDSTFEIDDVKITRLAARLCPHAVDRPLLLRLARGAVHSTLQDPAAWGAIEGIADALQTYKTLSARMVACVVSDGFPEADRLRLRAHLERKIRVVLTALDQG